MSYQCRISQNLAQAVSCWPARLFPEWLLEGEDRLKCLNNSREMEELSSWLDCGWECFRGLLKDSQCRLFQFLKPTTKLLPAAMPVNSSSHISSASTAKSLLSSPSPSSPHRLLPHTNTCPSLDSNPKCRPIAISYAPLRKLILVGYLNTPTPPLPHRNHQLLAVFAAQQLPPVRATTSSQIANLRGTWTSVSWPRPSWQFWLIPVPQTPFEVMKREYLAPAKMQLAGQTLSQCGQQQIFRDSRPSCPSLLLPHPNTFEPHSAKLWSLPALIFLAPFKATSKPPETAGLPRPSSP